jgi:hypothetical protein
MGNIAAGILGIVNAVISPLCDPHLPSTFTFGLYSGDQRGSAETCLSPCPDSLSSRSAPHSRRSAGQPDQLAPYMFIGGNGGFVFINVSKDDK